MSKVDVEIVSLSGRIPEYKSKFASGFDVEALLIGEKEHFIELNKDKGIVRGRDYDVVEDGIILKPKCRVLVPTGIFMSIPVGYEVQVRPRSGTALSNGISIVNSPGTIDSDYRGECCVILINTSNSDFPILNGQRIAQFVVCPVMQANFIVKRSKDELSTSERGSGGFGSSGLM